MNIYLKESQVRSLEEKLGVPEGLIKVSTNLYPTILQKISELTPNSFQTEVENNKKMYITKIVLD